MAPVKKQKANKKLNSNDKREKAGKKVDESVISGQLQKKINKKKHTSQQKDPKGVVFIKHLPHGFFEEQLKKYFEQFGNVTRVRLARSRRTGNSKGFAFVEFEYPEVAEVAAETMNNYLMFKQIVKASYIPPEKQQFNYFRTSVKKIRNKSGKLVWVSKRTAAINQKVKIHNDWSEENYQKRTAKQLDKLKKIGEKYAHLGIDINKIIVQPKVLTAKEDKDTASSNARKRTSKDAVSSNIEISKKPKKGSLEDLLGDTLPEDSEDEDYMFTSDSNGASEESDESSDEETYGFAKSSSEEDEPDDSDGANDSETLPTLPKNSKISSKKISKASNVERFDKIIKRKPLTGGINKLKTKPVKQLPIKAKKAALQMTAAKELGKPLSKIKGKLSNPLKTKKNVIKMK